MSGSRKQIEQTELVIGLVVPTGSDLSRFNNDLKDHFVALGYKLNCIKLSALLSLYSGLGVDIKDTPPYERIKTLMDAGDALRTKFERGDALALLAATRIKEERRGDPLRPCFATVHVLESLKHPEEVRTLRSIYGPGFFLLGLNRSEARRRDYFASNKGLNPGEIEELIERDQNGSLDLGQQTRDTFELADAFINLDDPDQAKTDLFRIIDLIFGHPFLSPTMDEHAMFLAYASSFRSADLSRQVGAVVVSKNGDVIGTGANEVPKYGGGQYISGAPDRRDERDYVKGYDSNTRARNQIVSKLEEAIEQLTTKKIPAQSLHDLLGKVLDDTPVSSLTEFGRAVHAEMEALLSCGRAGISTVGSTVYTTTFPCHNCAKHIVDAGVERVVYVEPYPKSKALDLHNDSISLGQRDVNVQQSKVAFEPFVGVAARSFVSLFSMRLGEGTPLKRKTPDGEKTAWDKNTATPRLKLSSVSYIRREEFFINQMPDVKSDQPNEVQSGKGKKKIRKNDSRGKGKRK